MVDWIEEGPLEIPPDGTSLDLLQAAYRNSALPLAVRLRAAGLAINYEHARLAVNYEASTEDFATLLDRRLAKLKEMKVIEHQPQAKVETKAPPVHTVDRRFRRI
jgi:hypothetical protein